MERVKKISNLKKKNKTLSTTVNLIIKSEVVFKAFRRRKDRKININVTTCMKWRPLRDDCLVISCSLLCCSLRCDCAHCLVELSRSCLLLTCTFLVGQTNSINCGRRPGPGGLGQSLLSVASELSSKIFKDQIFQSLKQDN